MPWFKRDYGATDYRPEFERFEEIFNLLHGPGDMMMISTGQADATIVYLSLPDHSLAVGYLGRSSRPTCPQRRRCLSVIKMRSESASDSQFATDTPARMRVERQRQRCLAGRTGTAWGRKRQTQAGSGWRGPRSERSRL